jgi:hypothetical protein
LVVVVMKMMMHEGTWWISSKIDPRWKASGRSIVGGFSKPEAVDAAIALLKQRYGEPPEDLTWHYEKD